MGMNDMNTSLWTLLDKRTQLPPTFHFERRTHAKFKSVVHHRVNHFSELMETSLSGQEDDVKPSRSLRPSRELRSRSNRTSMSFSFHSNSSVSRSHSLSHYSRDDSVVVGHVHSEGTNSDGISSLTLPAVTLQLGSPKQVLSGGSTTSSSEPLWTHKNESAGAGLAARLSELGTLWEGQLSETIKDFVVQRAEHISLNLDDTIGDLRPSHAGQASGELDSLDSAEAYAVVASIAKDVRQMACRSPAYHQAQFAEACTRIRVSVPRQPNG